MGIVVSLCATEDFVVIGEDDDNYGEVVQLQHQPVAAMSSSAALPNISGTCYEPGPLCPLLLSLQEEIGEGIVCGNSLHVTLEQFRVFYGLEMMAIDFVFLCAYLFTLAVWGFEISATEAD